MDLDVVTIGRSSVDLYGAQIGGLLEDMASFRKYIGGSPTNIAAGTARLGLRSAVITKVGDEHFGRFVRAQLAREGVDVSGVLTDPTRLTALAILGIRDQEQFPLLFYRENCADMALKPDDIDPALIARARAVVATGTHLYNAGPQPAVLKALRLAREGGKRTALDIDYRPNLWGVAALGEGESRYVESAQITAGLQPLLRHFDLIVGTEEEFHIAGGSTDTIAALRAVRAVTDAVLVCKRGPMGASAFTDDIPDDLDAGEAGPGFPIEVFNVLGAGDGFMSGILRGWLDDLPWTETLTYANACGALAVSRHGCTPAYPSWDELQFFLKRGIVTPALRHDAELEHIHWATNRSTDWPVMRVFAFDHRSQFEEMKNATPDRIGRFKRLCLKAALRVADGQSGYGILCDGRLGRDALYEAAGTALWIGRPVEKPGSRPLELEIGDDFGSALAEWPTEHVVKVLCFCHADDAPEMWDQQIATISRLCIAARANDLEVLVEIIPSKAGAMADDTTGRTMDRLYRSGIKPDWWKLEPLGNARAWQACSDVIAHHDPLCRGIVVLGLEAPENELAASFAEAAAFHRVKGFAVGRTIFAEAAARWLRDEMSDADVVDDLAERYRRLCTLWDDARAKTEIRP